LKALAVQETLLGLTLALTVPALALIVMMVVGAYAFCDWVPDSTIARLPGATQAEVREWLGQPDAASPGAGAQRWYYRRPLRFAEFRVDFGPDGRVADWSYKW
jgi:hypothetical protein